MRPRSRLARAAGAALLCLAAPAGGEGRETVFDWCAAVATRPLERFRDADRCKPWWTTAELARAEVVMLSAGDLGPESEPGARRDRCYGELTLERHALWIREVREAARARGRLEPTFVAMVRFDLVGPRQALRPDFQPSFLVKTDRPWSEVDAFFRSDRSPDCRPAGCSVVEPGVTEPGVFPLRPSATGSVVYYLERSAPGQTALRVGWALGDLRNPAYRAWRVEEMRRMLALGGYDAVYLNHKLHQLRPRAGRPPEHWLGGRRAPNVSALNGGRDSLWTAPPRDYGYAEYVAGWSALAEDLRRAGVPYAVQLSGSPWSRGFDDPASPADEAASIRGVAHGARLVLLDRGPGFEAAVRELLGRGVRIVALETSCARPGARYGAPSPSEP